MKFKALFFLLCFGSIAFSQEINPKLIGKFESEMVDAKKDIEYYVLVKRFEDGFFDSLLMIHEKGKGVQHYEGTGKWWTKRNQLFLEYHQPDFKEIILEKLQYEIINDQEIRIISNDKERPKILRDYIERKIEP